MEQLHKLRKVGLTMIALMTWFGATAQTSNLRLHYTFSNVTEHKSPMHQETQQLPS